MCVKCQCFTYLGKIIDNQLKFQHWTVTMSLGKLEKEFISWRSCHHLMWRKPLGYNAIKLLFNILFLYRLYTTFGHLSANFKSSYNEVVKLAGEFGGCTFDDILAVYNKAMRSRCFRMVTTDNNSILTFDSLPSGRYCAVKSLV